MTTQIKAYHERLMFLPHCNRQKKNDLIFRIVFLVECKSSLDKPWLLFCTPGDGLPKPAGITQRISSRVAVHVQMGLAQDKNVQDLALFKFRAPVGYGLKQAFAKDKDIAYSAMFSVGNAAEARALLWTRHPHEARIVELIFPVIAIEGRLFNCWLGEADVISANEISSGTLLWKKDLAIEVLRSSMCKLDPR